jgi:hypothetical protein
MFKKLLVVVLSVSILTGCFVIAPFPGGYVGFDVPPVEVRASTDVSVQWDLIPGTSIYYAPQYPDMLYYSGYYYYVANGVWYMGPRYTGPWHVLYNVPDVFLYIPPTHPEFRLVPWHPRYHEFYKGHTPAYYPPVRREEGPEFRREGVPPERRETPGEFRRDGPTVTPPQGNVNPPHGGNVNPPHGGNINPPPQPPHNPPPPQTPTPPKPPKEPKKDKPAEKDKDKDEKSADQPEPAPFHRR